MSKLIVEMKMPKNCPCELSAEVFDPNGNYGGYQPCFAWYGIPARSKEFDRCVVRSERPSWCPIVGELPEQHGRIIDEAVFCENVVKYSHQSTKTIGKALDATPTILDMTLVDAERSET